jgi:hypothetical protein
MCAVTFGDIGTPPTIWWVDDDQTGQGNGSINNPFATIQEGIDAAATGDVVRVRDGTYDENINSGKSIKIRSDQGAEDCSIVGDRTTSVVYLWGGSATLDGFTISNGYGRSVSYLGSTYNCGGGVFVGESDATVKNCVIHGCDSYNFGGGIYVGLYGDTDTYPEIASTITNNVIYDCSSDRGGGIYVEFVTEDCSVSWNEIYECGGFSASAICVYYFYNGFTLDHNYIHDNGELNDWGTVYLLCQEPYSYPYTCRHINVVNNVIVDNYGYGIAAEHAGYVHLYFNTVAGNYYGGIVTRGGTSGWYTEEYVNSVNDIYYDNGDGLYGYQIEVRSSSTFGASYMCIEDGEDGFVTYSYGSYTYDSYTCIDEDPELSSDGHLSGTSPCIDSGYDFLAYTYTRDIDGQSRWSGDHVDIGADEVVTRGKNDKLIDPDEALPHY